MTPAVIWGGVSVTDGAIKGYQYGFSLKEKDGSWEVSLPFGQDRRSFQFKSYSEAIDKIMSHYNFLRDEGIIE